MKVSTFAALLASFFLLVPAVNAADDTRTLFQKCDRNGDGRLDDREFYVYSLHTGPAAAFWEKVDPSYKGLVNSAALQAFEKASQDAAETQVVRERTVNGGTRRDAEKIETFYPSGDDLEPNPRLALGGFEIARTYEQITADPEVLNDKQAAKKAFEAAEPALFSYTRDMVSQERTWIASGVIARPIKLAPEFWLTPSVAIDRTQTLKDDSKEKDSLIFRVEYSRTIPDFLGSRSTTFRGDVYYNTDTGFNREAPGGELDIQPATGLLGNERFSYNVPGIKFRWDAFLHLEGGSQLGSPPSSEDNREVFRMGPKVGIDVYLLLKPSDLHSDWNNRIHLALDYNYYAAFGTAHDARLLRASANAYLDSQKHVSLSLEYTNGFAPLQNTKSEALVLALGVKF